MSKIFKYKIFALLFKQGLSGIAICIIFFIIGCKKFIDVGSPITNITDENVYKNNGTAAAVLTSLFADMRTSFDYGICHYCCYYTGLLADELALYNHLEINPFYRNDLNNSSQDEFWRIYAKIYITNAAEEGLNKTADLTPSTKKQLLGEAKFMRAFYYFYLVNFFGDVPLALSTDYTVNSIIPRTSAEAIYKQIIKDLKQADSLMSGIYLDGTVTNETVERLRPTKWAAKTLLARAYLYNEEWSNAEVVASEVINQTPLFELLPLDQTFLKNSRETIWALQAVKQDDLNAGEGNIFVLPSTGPTGDWIYPVYLSDFVLQAFETGDQRKTDWVGIAAGYSFPYKYKAGRGETSKVEYSIVLRLAELYLIRAEARIRQDKISEGIADLNKIRDRATDKTAPAANQLKQLASDLSENKAIEAVLHERYVELFTEWGHRWLDLKRTNTIDARMKIVTPVKGGVEWKPYQALFPIPLDEIRKNPSLVGHQNPGYSE